MSREKRSALMARIRGRNTGPERTVARLLDQRRVQYLRHDGALPGKPDITLPRRKVAVFVDGDFWHGWRFPAWKAGLPPFWRSKIEANRRRDRRNFRRIRRLGWRVVRLWEHRPGGVRRGDPGGARRRPPPRPAVPPAAASRGAAGKSGGMAPLVLFREKISASPISGARC